MASAWPVVPGSSGGCSDHLREGGIKSWDFPRCCRFFVTLLYGTSDVFLSHELTPQNISDISEHFARSSAGSNMSLFAAVHARYLSGFGHWHGALVLMMTIGTTEILNVVLIRRLLVVNMLNTLKGLHPQDSGAHMLPALAKRF